MSYTGTGRAQPERRRRPGAHPDRSQVFQGLHEPPQSPFPRALTMSSGNNWNKDPGFSKASMNPSIHSLQVYPCFQGSPPPSFTVSFGKNWNKIPRFSKASMNLDSPCTTISLFQRPSPHYPGATGNKDLGFSKAFKNLNSLCTKSLFPRFHHLFLELKSEMPGSKIQSPDLQK